MLYTVTIFTASGVFSRCLSLGLQNKAYSTDIAKSGLWVAAWALAGWSYSDWKVRQEGEYVKTLQYLVDRKERNLSIEQGHILRSMRRMV